MAKNRVLGKGLSALISENKMDFLINKDVVRETELNIRHLTVGKFQPRKHFDENSLNELSTSIKKNGVISPIIVREIGQDNYEIIAGERRWRASKLAGLTKVPVIIKMLSDKEALEIAIVENIQRRDLTAIEEANGYKRLIEEFNYTQEELSNILGKSRSHIANFLRLLSLPENIKEMVESGTISAGHARAIINCESPQEVAEEIVKNKLSVRETEKIIKENYPKKIIIKNPKETKLQIRDFEMEAPKASEEVKDEPFAKDSDIIQIENSLSDSLGAKVLIEDINGESKIVIHFKGLNQLENILQKIR